MEEEEGAHGRAAGSDSDSNSNRTNSNNRGDNNMTDNQQEQVEAKQPFAYIIEDGVPIPKKGVRQSGNGIVAWLRRLEVGQSMVVPLKQSSMTGSVHHLRKEGRKFTTRKVDAKSCRVWRVT